MIDLYKIPGAINSDPHKCFESEETYPQYQEELKNFKSLLVELVENEESKTFYKFGDGDYYFLRKESVGSAQPGRRALSKSYDEIGHERFVDGASKCDYYTCELYPENRSRFRQVISNNIDFPAEYGYALIANKWLFETFSGRIGLVGASPKMKIIENLMEAPQYQEYLGLDKFEDYISLPQRFSCDDLEATERMVGEQLKNSTSKIFLMGMGHVKSGLIHKMKEYTDAVFLDVGAGIDAISGLIDIERPYFADWTNYQIDGDQVYNEVDTLGYQGKGKHILLERA